MRGVRSLAQRLVNPAERGRWSVGAKDQRRTRRALGVRGSGLEGGGEAAARPGRGLSRRCRGPVIALRRSGFEREEACVETATLGRGAGDHAGFSRLHTAAAETQRLSADGWGRMEHRERTRACRGVGEALGQAGVFLPQPR